jgi:NAD(P)-dependent dehydrogenase (short-subunit alcohol dehydrogenase family)
LPIVREKPHLSRLLWVERSNTWPRGLAMDLAPVRVNALSLGLVLTDSVKQMPEAKMQAIVGPLPIPRGATPAEAAKAYVYLMLNDYTTGQILNVDGGGLLI